ncbi:type II toxin-antitoxin system PemK/MazF family toxin [Arthrobacter sp. ATA002]|uniref:type II toxin-antitoxin system PemK/MazF family toxin n=1 Tax=Arthrobacter sp. ATA002 TaxID=2991715 RepID=UPI0022A7CB88|nr:type II toxin-antitoxin system PemK/MazF family toxin [Arthrobacter sp. ATA002]WAP53143.1 type II toxin-antitoxin system PemK/MazF family toxin [Arthrobacter sp. ATA002]
MSSSSRSFLSLARSALRLLIRSGTGSAARPGRSAPGSPTTRNKTAGPKPAANSSVRKSAPTSTARKPAAPGAYPGDYRGKVAPVYAPSPDGSPDPGEVVWAWVPYEDDYSQGKDRPVLLIGRSGPRLLALMMTTRDRNNGRESDPDYVDVGTGPWDSRGRPSEVKLDRVLQLDPAAVRRQGAVMSAAAFQRVASRFSARN